MMADHSIGYVLNDVRRSAIRRDGAGLSDGALLEGFLAGRDEAYFEALVHRHGPMVLGVCRRLLRNPHDVDDAFQATFLVLVRRANTILPRDRVGNWLYGVAYRTAREARRLAARRNARERSMDESAHPAPAGADGWKELRPVLDREIERLPDKYRSALVLCELEGRTRKDVARQLGVPEGTVSGRLTTARRLLAKRLARRGMALSAGTLAATLGRTPVSAALMAAAVRVPVSGGPSPAAIALADAVGHAAAIGKLKSLGIVLVAVAASGIGLAVYSPGHSRPDGAKKSDAPIVVQAGLQALDRDKLQGTWNAAAWEIDGIKAAEQDFRGHRLVFTGDRVAYWTNKGAKQATVRLNPDRTPREIDLTFDDGATLAGIYDFDGSRLRLCWSKIGGRPASFDTTVGDILTFLYVYEKQP